MMYGNLSIHDQKYLNVQPYLDLNLSHPQLKRIVFSQFEYSETANVRIDDIDMWAVPKRTYAGSDSNSSFYFTVFLIISGVLALFIISAFIVCYILVKYPKFLENMIPGHDDDA